MRIGKEISLRRKCNLGRSQSPGRFNTESRFVVVIGNRLEKFPISSHVGMVTLIDDSGAYFTHTMMAYDLSHLLKEEKL